MRLRCLALVVCALFFSMPVVAAAALGGSPGLGLRAQVHYCNPGDDPLSCAPKVNGPYCQPYYDPGLSTNGFIVTWSTVISCEGPYNNQTILGKYAGTVDADITTTDGKTVHEHLRTIGPLSRTFSQFTTSFAVSTGSYNCETTTGTTTVVTGTGTLQMSIGVNHDGWDQVICN